MHGRRFFIHKSCSADNSCYPGSSSRLRQQWRLQLTAVFWIWLSLTRRCLIRLYKTEFELFSDLAGARLYKVKFQKYFRTTPDASNYFDVDVVQMKKMLIAMANVRDHSFGFGFGRNWRKTVLVDLYIVYYYCCYFNFRLVLADHEAPEMATRLCASDHSSGLYAATE